MVSHIISSQHITHERAVDDLASMDPELYRGLVYLKHYEGDDVESVFSLNFTVTIEGL